MRRTPLHRKTTMKRGACSLSRGRFERKKADRPKGRRRLKEQPYHSITRKCGLRDALDIEVSKAVRESNPACVICGESDWQKLTCGHLFKRWHEPTRFDTHEGGNNSTLCKSCNNLDNEDHGIYERCYKRRFGLRAYRALEKRARSDRRFEPYELRAMLDELKRRKAAHYSAMV